MRTVPRMPMQRIRANRGFSLTEMLVAIMILTLATSVVAMGIPAANAAYNNVVDGSNAQVLLSTTATLLRDKIDMATNISSNTEETTLTFNDPRTGRDAELWSDSSEGIMVKDVSANAEERLASQSVATGNLIVLFDNVLYDEDANTVTFTNLYVKRADASNAIVSLDEYVIRVLTTT